MATLQEIDKLTRKYADLRAKLADEVRELNDEVEAAKRRHLSAIKGLVETAGEAHGELREAIADEPGLFVKPRTLTLHGVKVGYRKAVGGIEFEDADQVVKLIRKHHTEDECELLIITREKPNKEALEGLDVAALKKIGCTVTETGDVVFIKDTASDVDKVVTALLKEQLEEVEA